jgi:Condensation domain
MLPTDNMARLLCTLQMADYAAWQQQHLAGEVLDAKLAWWKQTLAGAPPLLEMPWDRQRPDVFSPVGIAVALDVAPDVAAALQQLASGQHTTLFVVLLAAVHCFLSRYSGQEDVVVGTPYGGRGQEEVQQLAGCLVNTLALRMDLSGDPSFQQLLQRAVKTAMAAFEHADAPFARVVDELRLDRSAAFNPVYQVPCRSCVTHLTYHQFWRPCCRRALLP